MTTRYILALSALLLVANGAASRASAEEPSTAATEQAPQDARFMLRAPASADAPTPTNEKTAADFAWSALTTNGAASGANPIIGEGSGKAYYEFADGRPHPYYILPAKK